MRRLVLDCARFSEGEMRKALEAAYREGFLAGTGDGWVNNPRIDVGWKHSLARASLAELKGERGCAD